MDEVLQKLLRGVLDNGWDGIENAGQKAADFGRVDRLRRQEEAEREARIVRQALATPAGQALLELLLGKTILRGPSEEELTAKTAEAYAIVKARREGQAGVVFMLLNMLRSPEAPHTPEGGST